MKVLLGTYIIFFCIKKYVFLSNIKVDFLEIQTVLENQNLKCHYV